MGDTVKSFWNPGVIVCNGSATVYELNGETVAAALGLPAGTPTIFHTKNDRAGYNQITVSVSGIGAKTWKLEAANGAHWLTLASGLAVDVPFITHGIGPQVGRYDHTATPRFDAVPAFRAAAYRVTLSAADAAGRIHLTAECFDS